MLSFGTRREDSGLHTVGEERSRGRTPPSRGAAPPLKGTGIVTHVLGIMGRLKHYIGFKRGIGNWCKGPGNVEH